MNANASDRGSSPLGRDGEAGVQGEAHGERSELLETKLDDALAGLVEPPVRGQVTAVVRRFMATYKGPLPPPENFDAYEKTLPGAAHRILAIAEREQRHRHRWELLALCGQFALMLAGTGCGLYIAIRLIDAAVQLTLAGYPVVGGSMITVTGVAMVAGFLKIRPLLSLTGGQKDRQDEAPRPAAAPGKRRASSRKSPGKAR